MMEEKEFIDSLTALAREADVSLSEEQAGQCGTHVRLMLEWNRKVNLTRITDPREIMTKHILDSLIPARWLPREGLALDVGTGAGFPGVPLKILNPGLHMVLLEASRKKSSFLRLVLSRLGLAGIQVLQDRWEEFRGTGDPGGVELYSLIVMRAVRLETEHLSRLAARILRTGGVFAWWAGPSAEAGEYRSSRLAEPGGMAFEGEFSYTLPTIASPRRLLVWKKRDG